MTRLDPTGEPSMEEILASIRRIIAEDPPGSRPEPEGKPAAPQAAASKPAFGPLSAHSGAPAGREGDKAPAAGREVQTQAEPSPSGFFSHRPAFDAPRALVDTLADPLSSPLTHPVADRQAGTMQSMSHRPVAPAPAPSLDIDAQLADVLGGPAKTHATGAPAPTLSIGTPLVGPRESSKESVQAALDSLGGRADRGGFTVSRDGYVPEKTEVSSMNAPAVGGAPISREPDPFEFTLGPSPFARKPETLPADPAVEARNDPFGAFIPTREAGVSAIPAQADAEAPPVCAPKHTEPDLAAPDLAVMGSPIGSPTPASSDAAAPSAGATVSGSAGAYDPFGEISFRPSQPSGALHARAPGDSDGGMAEASPVAVLEQLARSAPGAFEPMAAQEPDAPGDSEAPVIAAPDVLQDAQSAPQAVEQAAAGLGHEAEIDTQQRWPTLSEILPRKSETTKATSGFNASAMPAGTASELDEADVEIVEPELEDIAPPSSQDAIDQRSADPESAMDSYTPSDDARSLVPRASQGHDAPATRTMEDTVAELLRPMLRTWLAENMPKIVERALRKELADKDRGQRNPAAE